MATAYATIASGGYRNRPIAITKVRFPDGTPNCASASRSSAERVRGRRDRRGDADPRRTSRAAPARKANIGCPAAGKTGTTDNIPTPGSSASRRACRPPSWVGYPNAQIHMSTEYHGGPVAGGTFPAEIWGDYMKAVKGKFCGDFPPPTTPFNSSRSSSASTRPAAAAAPAARPTRPNAVRPSTSRRAHDRRGGRATGRRRRRNGKQRRDGNGRRQRRRQRQFDPDLYESPPQGAPPATAGRRPKRPTVDRRRALV